MIEVKDVDEREYLIECIEGLEATIVSLEKRTYAAPHVWNLVAKMLREEFARNTGAFTFEADLTARSTITDLALAFAKRFSEDEGFDPISWLDKCSPDTDLYPFSELWNDGE